MHRNYYVLQKLSAYKQLVHGFATKAAGDMEFKYRDAKNGERRRALAQNLGVPSELAVKMEQIHGTNIAVVGFKDAVPIESHRSVKGVDGLLTKEHGICLFAKTADCLPIIYFDVAVRAVGLAHAGWRGVVGKLPALMVAKMMEEFGSDPKNILVGIGPCLDKRADVVDPPVLQLALPEWQRFLEKEDDKVRVDLVGFTLHQLEQVGVPLANVEVGGVCTALETEEFFSTKADPNERRRFGTLVGLRK